MEDFSITITKCDNGYLCEYYEDVTDDVIKHQYVIEETDDDTPGNMGELSAMRNLLYYIKEYFGVHYSKHNKENITIDIERNTEDE